ncbi:hypothetical protein FE257_001317 [Aspergillus nanangensis]|uniref:Alcohol dehydrogenase-like N-terminal domain-containing protein n=1 Tax=Aspergillus nanangensis TaxID=2582783 RepID=A0AAD4CF71_ASPNN|nr:hypothetical protein FE257_001317 [Aspergillus nanangensis]
MSPDQSTKTMKAIVWEGKPFHMAIKDLPIPQIKDPNDVVIRITTTAICGTDLHTYRGVAGSKTPPWTMGHEGIGTIVQAGNGVKSLRTGDRVVAGVICCGYCDNCLRGFLSYCLTFDPPVDVDLPGLGSDYGPDLGGTQAEYLRIPFADSTCYKLPPNPSHDLDYIFLSDIFPTGWFAVDCSGFQPGDTVAVFGAGPVGLLAAYSALLRGASRVYSIDYISTRLQRAASIGAIPINFTKCDAVAEILKVEPRGVHRSCDCVGFECLNENLEPEENIVLNNCIKVTATTGGIGFIGEYTPRSGPTAGAPLRTGKEGVFPVLTGLWWAKSLAINGGVAEIRRLQPTLQRLIESGRAKPSFVISEVLHSLEEVPGVYERFARRQIGKPVVQLAYDDHDREMGGGG